MTVPTIGMKFSGRYMTYRMIAFGVNFANGFLNSFPSRAMGSPPAWICLSLDTRFVHSFERRVPSKVSIRASSMRKVRERRLMIVELSLSVRSAAENAAIGPDVNAIIAAWGRYATKNMRVVTPRLKVIVGASLDISGRHSALCVMK